MFSATKQTNNRLGQRRLAGGADLAGHVAAGRPDPGFLNDLLLRTLYGRGAMLGLDLARRSACRSRSSRNR